MKVSRASYRGRGIVIVVEWASSSARSKSIVRASRSTSVQKYWETRREGGESVCLAPQHMVVVVMYVF